MNCIYIYINSNIKCMYIPIYAYITVLHCPTCCKGFLWFLPNCLCTASPCRTLDSYPCPLEKPPSLCSCRSHHSHVASTGLCGAKDRRCLDQTSDSATMNCGEFWKSTIHFASGLLLLLRPSLYYCTFLHAANICRYTVCLCDGNEYRY